MIDRFVRSMVTYAGDLREVAEESERSPAGDGEHCSRFRSDEVQDTEQVAQPSADHSAVSPLAGAQQGRHRRHIRC